MDTFPFRNRFTDIDDIKLLLGKLKDTHTCMNISQVPTEYHNRTMSNVDKTKYKTHSKDSGKFYSLPLMPNTYLTYGLLSDYFQEHLRIQAKRNDDISPLEYWEQNKDTICAQTDSVVEQRDLVRKNVKECTQFHPGILVGIIKLFHAKKILDFCSGWGDRLAACISMDEYVQKYTGIDVNKSLFNGYEKMIKNYLPKHSRHKYEMIRGDCIEVLPKISDMYDLVFTCPPYFDKEIYEAENKDQSIQKYTENWIKDFLVSAIGLAYSLLKKDGHIVIAISGFEEILIEKLAFLADYRGIIKCADLSLMVWCKTI